MDSVEIGTLSELAPGDIAFIASLHAASIPYSRFASLPANIQMDLYKYCVEAKEFTVFTVRNSQNVIIGGALVERLEKESRDLLKFLLKNYPFQILWTVIKHPIRWALQTLVEIVLSKNSTSEFYLTAIYTAESARKSGVGSRLLQAIEKLGTIGIITELKNPVAIRFYKRNNYAQKKKLLGSCYLSKIVN